ncbi:FliI/YscN family ATPase [Pandoraea commovens]|uniref:ATP synthase n=1 Tax=Pandoraea commovens TaxID=2508289 RepID=A0A5E4WB00_9BURK|nr:FliI/YscN family ATPase [Pandoraea commovens]VVE20275.1 ATP synthase [Pandoraea commovens]
MYSERLHELQLRLSALNAHSLRGRVEQVQGTLVRARVPRARIGDLCILQCPDSAWERPAEVVSIEPGVAVLAPFGDLAGLSHRTEVLVTNARHRVRVGDALVSQVLNGFGDPLNSAAEPLDLPTSYAVDAPPPVAIERELVSCRISTGVRAIDGVLTCAEGQRIGIFAAAGGGKTSLLAMLVKGTDADICVVALIGERGREVREFMEHDLGEAGLKKSVLIVATADRPAAERLKAGFVATAIAEYFRDQGKRVLLLMDSVTRLARAQREIGLAVGEMPARQGFPASMFALLPRLFERAGTAKRGSITAFYSVLVEGDDMTEPVADEVRSLLDGHIILSRALGAEMHYPAIDVLASLSRVMKRVASAEHMAMAEHLRKLMAKYKEIELLVKLGEYQGGTDAIADEALAKIEGIRTFLKQRQDERVGFDSMLKELRSCLN